MATNDAFRPLIFISHSARNDASAYLNLKLVKKHLIQKGFDVLIDETRIDGGEAWRDCINTWLAHCHGAIILLTPKALESPWVQKEAAILSWRRSRSRSKEFKLLPVLLGVSADNVKDSKKFGVLELVEYEYLMNLEGLSLAKKLAALLDPLRTAQATTPRQLAEHKLACLLSEASAPLLESIIRSLGEDAGGWEPHKDLAGKTAMVLLQASLKKVAETNALLPLKHVVSHQKLAQIIAMLQASWIDVVTAAAFIQISAQQTEARAAALNGTEIDFTERSLFARANGGGADWDYIALSDRTGEDQGGSMIGQVEAWCRRRRMGKDREAILKAIKVYVQTTPFLIVLPPVVEDTPWFDEQEVDRLLDAYPLCTFLVLSGATPLADRLQKFVRLSPQLEKEAETDALVNFGVLRALAGIVEGEDAV